MNGKKLLWMIILGMFLLIRPVLAVQDYVSFTFTDTDIKNVVKTIARSTGSNIICEKSVSGKITLSLKDVYYERALELVAKTNGYVVRKIDNTYVIGPAQKLAEGFDVGLNRTYKLNYAEAESVSKVISGIFKKAEVPIEVSTDSRVNAVVVSGNQNALDKIDELIKTIDVPVHQVMIEAKIVEITTNGSRDLGFKWGWGNDEAGTNGQMWSASESLRKITETETFQKAPVGGPLFNFGTFYRKSEMFSSTLVAAESTGNGKTLSNPKIMAMNGKEATVQVGGTVVYTGGPTQPPQEKEVGVILKITPRINDEGWITMDVQPEVSTDKWELVPGSTTVNPYPKILKRIAKTTVKVKDGEEIMIGGLIQQKEDNTDGGVPVLCDVPILKTFFSQKGKKSESTELIFLITPHIIQQVEG